MSRLSQEMKQKIDEVYKPGDRASVVADTLTSMGFPVKSGAVRHHLQKRGVYVPIITKGAYARRYRRRQEREASKLTPPPEREESARRDAIAIGESLQVTPPSLPVSFLRPRLCAIYYYLDLYLRRYHRTGERSIARETTIHLLEACDAVEAGRSFNQ